MDKKDKITGFKKAWFGAITTKDEAIRAIKEATSGFYAVAVIDILIGIFLWKFYVVEGIIYLVIATILRLLKSRGAAIILFLISIAAIISTAGNFVSKTPSGGRNIFLALIILGASIRAIQATYKFHKFPECAADCKRLGKFMLIWGAILIPVSIFSFLFVSIFPYLTLKDEASINNFFKNALVNSIFGLFVILCITAFAITIEGIIIKLRKPKSNQPKDA
ncbi:MAG: hypothetical protein PHP17_01370 [Candidatus Omnitrophica bacterium]|nr:hypothetical protein [Candidatus Omnitrophota bacterium]